MEEEVKRMTWLYGRHPVEEALSEGTRRARELLVLHEVQNPAVGDLVRRARAAGAQVRWVSRKELERACGTRSHQGLALRAAEHPTKDIGSFLASVPEAERATLVLVALDQIQDPHNLGAVARSAACLGGRALLVCDRRTAPVTPAAVAASAGALEKLPVLNVGNLAQALADIKERGFWIYGADMSGKPAWETAFNLPMVFVIGSEGSGLRRLVAERCDELVGVPQSGRGVASLNVSCAASVLLYEVARQAGRTAR